MNKRALFVLIAYGVVSAVGLHNHELFLDEAHHFLVSRDSPTLGDFYYNLRYDAHPRLWGALLYFITHFITADPAGMQVLQWLFVMAGAYALLRYGPFTFWMKVLILAGYYFLYEYDVLSRNYAIGIWMLWLCCHLLRGGDRNVWWLGALMVLMCSAHLFFAFAAAGIFLDVLAERRWRIGRLGVLTCFFVAGLATSIIQAKAPAMDNVNMTPVHPEEWLSGRNLSFAAGAFVQGWLPVPQVNGGRFWNTGWLNAGHLGPVAPWVLCVALLAFPAYVLRRRVPAMLFYYSTVGLMLLFFVVTQMTANRYFGMGYVFFLAAAWLTADWPGLAANGSGPAANESGPVLSPGWIPGGRAPGRLWWTAWLAILAVQVLVGVYAYEEDLRRPFSQSRNAAEYLRKLQPEGRPVVLDGYNAGPQLCAYLQDKLYCLATGVEGSYCVWRKAYFPTPRLSIGEELARNPGLQRMGEFILVSNRNLGGGLVGAYRLTPLKTFENSIVGENYFIYRVDPAL
ncbi:MAG TPA: hypothetical protein VFE32_07985 [Puia sp.]|jgi:hypothetical protein|nr:hypothetical protein [Puia sp.]